ncbi:hypothetical protein CCYA_CCYA13G3449 [Cyanidiococcus yangmingshanensis]|nr:hypothetical protein CCYA_CCYA13G3449 [Cyanidiococcus yangmingshanensis]
MPRKETQKDRRRVSPSAGLSSETEAASGLGGFLFGNVDAEGRLEADYLDPDAKATLHLIAPIVLNKDELIQVVPERVDFSHGAENGAADLVRSVEVDTPTELVTSAPEGANSASSERQEPGSQHQSTSTGVAERSTPTTPVRTLAPTEPIDFYDASDLSDEAETQARTTETLSPKLIFGVFDKDAGSSKHPEGQQLDHAEDSWSARAHDRKGVDSGTRATARQDILLEDYDEPEEHEIERTSALLAQNEQKKSIPAPLPVDESPVALEHSLTLPYRLLKPCVEDGILRFTRFLVPEEATQPFRTGKRKRIQWQSKTTEMEDRHDSMAGEELLFQRPDDLDWISFPYAHLILDDMQDVEEMMKRRFHRRVIAEQGVERATLPRLRTDDSWQSVPQGALSTRLNSTPWIANQHHGFFGVCQRVNEDSGAARDSSTEPAAAGAFLWQQWNWEDDICWDIEQMDPSKRLHYLTDRERLEHDFYRNVALELGMWTEAIAWEKPVRLPELLHRAFVNASTASLELGAYARELARRFDWPCIDENDPQLILCRTENRLLTQPSPNLHLPLQVGYIESLIMNASNDRFYGIEMIEQRRRSARTEALANLRHALKARQGYTSAWCYGYTEPQTYYRPDVSPCLWQVCGQKPAQLMPLSASSAAAMSPHEARVWVPKSWTDLSAVSPKAPGQIYLLEYPLEADPFLVQLPGMASRLLSYSRRAADDAVSAPADDTEVVFLASDDLPPLHCGDVRPGQVVRVLENNSFAAPFERFSAPPTDFLVVCSAQRVLYVRAVDRLVAVGRLEPRNKPKVMIPNSDRMKRFVKNKIELDVTRELIRRGDVGVERAEIIQMFPRRRVYPETTIAGVLRETCDNTRNRYTIKRNYLEAVWPKREAELLRLVTPEETCAFESMEVGWEQLCAKGITIFSSPSMQGNIIGGAEKAGLGRRGIEMARYIREELAKTRWVRTELLVRAQKSLQFELRSVLSAATLAMDILRGDPTAEDRLKTMSRDDALRFLKVQFSCNLNPSQRAAIEAPETRAATVRQIALERARQRPLVPLAVQMQRLIDQHIQSVRALSLERQILLLREGYPKSTLGRGRVFGPQAGVMSAPRPGMRPKTTAAERSEHDIEERREFSRLLATHRAAESAQNGWRQRAFHEPPVGKSGSPHDHTEYVLKRRLKIIRKVDGQEQVRYIEDPYEIEAYKQHRRLREDALRTGIGGGIGFAAKSMTQSRKAGKKGTAEERLRERLEELAEAARRINAWTLGASALGESKPTVVVSGAAAAGHGLMTHAVNQIREAMRSNVPPNTATGSFPGLATYEGGPTDGLGSVPKRYLAQKSEMAASNPSETTCLRLTLPSSDVLNDAGSRAPSVNAMMDTSATGDGLFSSSSGIREHASLPAWLAPDLSGGVSQESSQSATNAGQRTGTGLVSAPNRLKLRIPSGLGTSALPTLSPGARENHPVTVTDTSSTGLARILIRPPTEEPEASISASTRTSSGLEVQPSSSKSSTLTLDQAFSPRPGPRARASKRSSGKVHLNNILREVEAQVRDAEGVVIASTPFISVARVHPGEPPPPGALDRPAKLAVAGNIDFINPVRDATYRKLIPLPKQVYLQKIRRKCEEVAYGSVEEFLSDMQQLAENARQYHTAPEAHWVVQHAEFLYEAAQEEIAKRRKDIDEAIQKDAHST